MADYTALQAKINALKALVQQGSITPTYLGAILDDIIANARQSGMQADDALSKAEGVNERLDVYLNVLQTLDENRVRDLENWSCVHHINRMFPNAGAMTMTHAMQDILTSGLLNPGDIIIYLDSTSGWTTLQYIGADTSSSSVIDKSNWRVLSANVSVPPVIKT